MTTVLPTQHFLWFVQTPAVKHKSWTLPDGAVIALEADPSRPNSAEFGLALKGIYTPPPAPEPTPSPVPAPAPLAVVAKPQMTGGSDPTDTVWCSDAKFSGGVAPVNVRTSLRRDGTPIAGADPKAGYVLTASDGGHTVDGASVATDSAGQTAVARSVNEIKVNTVTAPAPAPAPAPSPTPGTPTPTLPPTFLQDNGLSIKSFLGEFHDVSSDYWDCSPTGVPAHGSANGVCKSLRSNAFMRSDGAAIFRTTNDGVSIWATMIPRGLAGNGVSGGAAKGLVLPDRCIVETIFEVNAGLNYDKKGGPDDYHAYDWNGPYTQARSSGPGNVNYAEHDQLEFERWPGGDGHPTLSYHYPGDIKPSAITLGTAIPVADGQPHSTTWVKTGLAGAKAWVHWDKHLLPEMPYTIQDSFQHCMMFTGGYSTLVPPVSPLNFVVLALRVWQL